MSNYNIYVHGRPQGQDVWSTTDDSADRYYLQAFLDSRVGGDVPSALIIDVWQKHFYYTYIHCKNVTEKSVRPNAYFAITVRFDGICKNTSSLYNLLDLVYNKVCMGNLIAIENGQEHILVSQWTERINTLQQINTLLAQNIDKFILPSVSPVDNPKDTKDTAPQKWAFQDIDCPLFISVCQKNRIVVSPSYKSKDNVHDEDVKRVAPLEAECNKLKDSVSQWTSKFEAADSARITQEKKVKDLSDEVALLQKEIKTIKDEVANQYKDEISKLKSDKQKTESQLHSVQSELKDASSRLKCKEDLQKKYDDLQKKYDQLKRSKPEGGNSTGNNNDQDIIRQMADRFPVLCQKTPSTASNIVSKVSSWLSIVNTVVLAFCCLFIYTITKTNSNNELMKQNNIAPIDSTLIQEHISDSLKNVINEPELMKKELVKSNPTNDKAITEGKKNADNKKEKEDE